MKSLRKQAKCDVLKVDTVTTGEGNEKAIAPPDANMHLAMLLGR